MPRIAYIDRSNMGAAKRGLIERANTIIAEYQAQGFDLTLRQLYYQFVARGLIPNKQTEYKRLGDAINDGRLMGMIDWNAIVDRTRFVRTVSHWSTPGGVIESAAASYRMDKWADQKVRVEVWVEKDALVGVMETVCEPLDVSYLACRGYTSQSEMWQSAQRFMRYAQTGQRIVVLHFGDHDPSGIDMSRDIEERIRLFMGSHARQFQFVRVALNEDQVERYNPPPNPVKLTDSRAGGYSDRFGDESWELDALEPTVLANLVRRHVTEWVDRDAWDAAAEQEREHRAALRGAAAGWATLVDAIVADEVEEADDPFAIVAGGADDDGDDAG